MSQITILNQANVPMGPFTRDQVEEKLRTGEVTMSNLAFVEGLSQWTPLRDVLARLDAAAPASGAMATPPAPVTPPKSLAYSFAATMQPPPHLVYGGFWLRFVAIFIDGLILSPLSGISYLMSHSLDATDDNTAKFALAMGTFVFALLAIILRWLYFSLLESSAWQATIGKKVMGLRVTGLDGNRIGFGRATGRYFGKFISAIILCVGFMMAGWTERKQALHDMIAGTLVVRN